MRRWSVMVFVVVLLMLAGGVIYQRWREQNASPPVYPTVNVVRGSLLATVSATGTLEAQRTVTVMFETAGKVVAVSVEKGATVQPGELLVQLDDAEARLQVALAEANLKAAEAQLAQLTTPPAEADVAAARAALAAAQAAYQDLVAGPDPDEVAAARAAVDLARVDLEIAQAAYDRIKWRPDASSLPQARQLQIASINYEKALAQLRLAERPPTEAQLAQALANLAQAQANLDRLLQGVGAAQKAAQEAMVAQARVQLEQARLALARTQVRAPIAGTVTDVHARVGQWVGPGQPAVTLTVLRPLRITVYIDELDVTQVREGQTALVTVDALPERTFYGVVTYIAPVPTVQSGVVTYEARVELLADAPELRPGMSAAVEIVTAQVEDVLLLPNRVIRVDRETGKYYVEKQVNGTIVRVDVTLGLQNEEFSEIRDGVQEGDVIILRTVSTEEQLRRGLGFGQ